MRRGIVRVALGLVCVLILRSTAHAFFLDDQRRFDVRMRAYSQWSVMTQSSEHKGCVDADGKPTPATCPPSYQGGDLNQIRNFYNPEFDAKLTDFTSWMSDTSYTSWFSPEDLRFRFAWWGFYDYGVYDAEGWAGNPWNERRRNLKARFSQSDNPGGESFTFQDENKNEKMDFSWLGIPLERFGFSNDAKPFLDQPSFDEAKFELRPGPNETKITLRLLL